MRPGPSTLSLHRRLVWLMLLVGVLATRGLTPDGWMPVASADGGLVIAVCDGHGPGQTITVPLGKAHHDAPAKGQVGDHPCAFAGIGIADAAPPLPTVIAPLRPAATAPAIRRTVAAPGHGLAAPPPPATGPPALA